ncbi:MAG: hypothetical protein DYG89_12200 [Caldilinea sp. CFX5]|nr:hypothetical protein [Caldilinea sp. CFX5]
MKTFPEFTRLLSQQLLIQERSATWLARRLQLHPGTVNRWLNQELRPATPELVARIADLLGMYDTHDRQRFLLAAGYGYWDSHESNSAKQTPQSPSEPAPQPTLVVERIQPSVTPFMTPALPPQGIFGREEVLTRLFDLLQLGASTATNVPPVALCGMGGIGKTTLAIALSYLEVVSDLFPDGVLWASVGPQPTLRHWLESWGRALGLNLVAERNEASCCDRLRSALHPRRMLLLIDDVWEVHHGQAFLLAGPYCRTLFTTREVPVAFALATRQRTLPVSLLNPPAALALLTQLAPEIITTNQPRARLLCERLEFLPLALTLAGKLLAIEAAIPARVERLLSELIERRERRLQLLQTEERPGVATEQPVSLQAILRLSVERLNQVDQERFAMLAVFGGEPLTWESQAAAYVWACTAEEAEATIAHLIQRGLVMQRGEGYWLHTLLADYAAEMLAAMR